MKHDIKTPEDFKGFVREVEAQDGYLRPMAFGVGIANVSDEGGIILDAFFPFPNYKQNFGSAAVLASVVGHRAGTQTYLLDGRMLEEALAHFAPFEGDGKVHGNIDAIKAALGILTAPSRRYGSTTVVVSFIDEPDFDPGPQTTSDTYLRLHLLSHRLVKPNEIKLDGMFGKLPNNAWTNEGPISLEDLPMRRIAAMMRGQLLHVNAIDKFPRMVDYVVPSGVRIADASRVRLGAYLAPGTTVMHEGFCNFNAGTLGESMVEGRISAGVVVGSQSDIGGGASTMGMLSGGGKEKIRIGRGSLLGANSGIGISLGDLCVVEAGLYVTAGTPVFYNGEVVKAITLSGKDGLTFRRHGQFGRVEVLDLPNKVVLNDQLHKND